MDFISLLTGKHLPSLDYSLTVVHRSTRGTPYHGISSNPSSLESQVKRVTFQPVSLLRYRPSRNHYLTGTTTRVSIGGRDGGTGRSVHKKDRTSAGRRVTQEDTGKEPRTCTSLFSTRVVLPPTVFGSLLLSFTLDGAMTELEPVKGLDTFYLKRSNSLCRTQ